MINELGCSAIMNWYTGERYTIAKAYSLDLPIVSRSVMSTLDNRSNSTGECQLCFQQIPLIRIVEHLKEVHKVADHALYDKRPLARWFKQTTTTPLAC